MQDENRLQKDLNEHLNRIELLPAFSNHFMLNGVRRNTLLYMNFSNTEIRFVFKCHNLLMPRRNVLSQYLYSHQYETN